MGSARLERQLTAALEKYLAGAYELEVIDLKLRPEVAKRDDVIAAPTVIRVFPPPVRRIIGAFSDPEQVARALDLQVLALWLENLADAESQ